MAEMILRPNANGDETNLKQYPNSTSHWDKVDEVSQDGATTYVGTTNSNGGTFQRDLYNIENPPTKMGAISKITVSAYELNGAGTVVDPFYKEVIKTGGTVYEGTGHGLTNVWTKYDFEWATNPQTGQAWKWSDIDALQIGVSLKDASNWNYDCTQVYVTITYIPDQVTPMVFTAGGAIIG